MRRSRSRLRSGRRRLIRSLRRRRPEENRGSHNRRDSLLDRITGFAKMTALVAPLLFIGCPKEDPPSRPRATVQSSTRPNDPSPTVVTAFNGERAMDHVKKQIEFGPRPPDTDALAKTRAYIVN